MRLSHGREDRLRYQCAGFCAWLVRKASNAFPTGARRHPDTDNFSTAAPGVAPSVDYPKLHFNEKEQQCFLDIISEVAVLVEVPGRLKVILDDPDDDIILESAVAGGALSLISSDRHLLKLKTYCGVQIMTVTAFLEALEKQ